MSTEQRQPMETRLGRMEPLARLPVFFALAGRRVVVVGGSDAAAWKAELLSATGALVDVFAADAAPTLRAVAAEPPHGPVRLNERGWCREDLHGAALAVGAFCDEEDAAAFTAAARRAGVPVNVVDRPEFCDFAFGAIVNRSPLVIGISTDGGAPALAQWLRAKIEAVLPNGLKHWAEAAKTWRAAIQSASDSFDVRRRVWERFTRMAMAAPDRVPGEADLRCLLASVREAQAAASLGEVMLVGAGPGRPELLTLAAVRALQSADVILYDDLVSHEVLDFARREAKTMLVGKSGQGASCRQDEINKLIVGLARQGKRVVRLKGGDPGIFGRAGEEIEACTAAGVPVDIVPGVTAAQAAAASLKLPLTHRDHAQRVQFVTGHGRRGGLPPNLDYAALADPNATTCVYMGKATAMQLARKVIGAGLPADTSVVVMSNVSRPNERVETMRVEDLASGDGAAEAAAPVILMIGRVFAPAAAMGVETHESRAVARLKAAPVA